MRGIADLLSNGSSDVEALRILVGGVFLLSWEPSSMWALSVAYLLLCGYAFHRWHRRGQSVQPWPPQGESVTAWPPHRG